jgi:hypothetical protein
MYSRTENYATVISANIGGLTCVHNITLNVKLYTLVAKL